MNSAMNPMTGRFEAVSPEIRFNEAMLPEPNTGCWLWLGTLNEHGYGEFTVEEYTAKTFGSRFIEKGYVFLNDDMDLMMKLVETVNGDKRNVLYISNDMITSLKDFSLGDNLTPLLVTWLNDTYPQFNFNAIDIRLLF